MSATRLARIVAGSNPRPSAEAVAVTDVTGAFAIIVFALKSFASRSTSYPFSRLARSSLPVIPRVPPSGNPRFVRTARSRIVPVRRIGPVADPRNPAFGKNLPAVASESG